jgi:hypothetical protein
MTDVRAVLRDTASPYIPKRTDMKRINVVAFGGLGGAAFSAGLKTILMKLNGIQQIDYKTYEDWKSWRQWGATLQSWKDDTVLLAHSFGIPAAFGAIRAMGKNGPKIPLVVTFDPSQYWIFQPLLWGTGGNAAPGRVDKVLNFWQEAPFPFIGNQTVSRDDGSGWGITNHLVHNIMHGAVEDHPAAQDITVDEIKKVINRA